MLLNKQKGINVVVVDEGKSPDTAAYHQDEESSGAESPNKVDQLVDVGAAMIMCEDDNSSEVNIPPRVYSQKSQSKYTSVMNNEG